jgi:hypothetical protein
VRTTHLFFFILRYNRAALRDFVACQKNIGHREQERTKQASYATKPQRLQHQQMNDNNDKTTNK